LFNATIRENLDPHGYFQDLQLWNCLELAQLKEFVNGHLPLGLGECDLGFLFLLFEVDTSFEELSLSLGSEFVL